MIRALSLLAAVIMAVLLLRRREPERAVAPLRWRGPVLHDDSPGARLPRQSVATLLVKGDDRDLRGPEERGYYYAGENWVMDWDEPDDGIQPGDPYPASLLR